LLNKLEELGEYARQQRFDILGISESWVSKKKPSIQGFDWVGYNGDKGRGGVGFLINTLFTGRWMKLTPTYQGQLWIKFTGDDGCRDMFVCVVYMPQEKSMVKMARAAWDALQDSIAVYGTKGNVIVLGDCNAKLGEASDPLHHSLIGGKASGSRSRNGELFLDLLTATGLRSINGRFGAHATCYSPSSKCFSVIDYIVLDVPLAGSCSSFAVHPVNLGGSDHQLISCYISGISKQSRPVRKVSKWATGKLDCVATKKVFQDTLQASMESLQSSFSVLSPQPSHTPHPHGPLPCGGGVKSSHSSHQLNTGSSKAPELAGDKVMDAWLKMVNKAGMASCGKKSSFVGKFKSAKWFDAELKEAINARRTKWLSHKRLPSEESWKLYSEARKHCKSLVTAKKQKSWEEVMSKVSSSFEDNKKLFWATVKGLSGGSKASAAKVVKDVDGKPHYSLEGRKKVTADFYEALGAIDDSSDRIYDVSFKEEVESRLRRMIESSKDEEDVILGTPFTEVEIVGMLSLLKNRKACGEDGIPNEFLKMGGPSMVEAICLLFNWVRVHESIPSSWGKSILAILYKKGDATDLGNYRGISLISNVAKLFTKVLDKRIRKFLNEKNFLAEEQGGFRSGRDTVSQAYLISTTLLNRRLEGKRTYCFFLDLKKAFDTVWRDGLWCKLWDCGIKGKAWRVIRDIYGHTESSVLVDGELSRWFSIAKGVRQGCCLSPLLFNIFVNDLALLLKELGVGVPLGGDLMNVLMFADDMVLVADSPEELQKLMNCTGQFLRKWRLQENIKKCGVIETQLAGQTKPVPGTYTFNGCIADIVDVYTYLGLEISKDCGWSKHAKAMSRKGAKFNVKMAHIFKNRRISTEAKRTLVLSMLVPALDYAGAVWFGNSVIEKTVQAPQNKAMVNLLNINSKSNAWAYRGELGMLSSKSRRAQLRLSLLGKLVWMENTRLPKIAFLNQWNHVRRSGRTLKSWEKDTNEWICTLGLEEHLALLLCGAPKADEMAKKFNISEAYGRAVSEWSPPEVLGEAAPAALKEWNSAVKNALNDHEDAEFATECRDSSKMSRLGRIREGVGMSLQPWLKGVLSIGTLLKLKLRLGTNGLGEDQARINEVSGVCKLCNTASLESVDHFIACCPFQAFVSLRHNLVKSLSLSESEVDRGFASYLSSASARAFTDTVLGPSHLEPSAVTSRPPSPPRRRSSRRASVPKQVCSTPSVSLPVMWKKSGEYVSVEENVDYSSLVDGEGEGGSFISFTTSFLRNMWKQRNKKLDEMEKKRKKDILSLPASPVSSSSSSSPSSPSSPSSLPPAPYPKNSLTLSSTSASQPSIRNFFTPLTPTAPPPITAPTTIPLTQSSILSFFSSMTCSLVDPSGSGGVNGINPKTS
jgi:hypothetical protein